MLVCAHTYIQKTQHMYTDINNKLNTSNYKQKQKTEHRRTI